LTPDLVVLGRCIGVKTKFAMKCSRFGNLLPIGGFAWILPISFTNKTDRHDIAEILLKVALSTITLTLNNVVF
jgi:hypothetical protein